MREEIVKCHRCDNYYHTFDPARYPHKCKLFTVKFRQVVHRSAFARPAFSGEWAEMDVWAVTRRESLDKVLTDRFFRDGNSIDHNTVSVEMVVCGQRYVGEAKMKYDSKIKLTGRSPSLNLQGA